MWEIEVEIETWWNSNSFDFGSFGRKIVPSWRYFYYGSIDESSCKAYFAHIFPQREMVYQNDQTSLAVANSK